jgi:uncharacterized protein (TIGR00251 family)
MTDASLEVRVQPGATRQEIGDLREGVLTVRVNQPPLDGRANKAVCQLVAKHLGIAPSHVSIKRGAHSRSKLLEIRGLSPEELTRRLSEPRPLS